MDQINRHQRSDPYLLSKLIQEDFVRHTHYSKSVRVSNFYGPGYIGKRLIPRIIIARITGTRASAREELRNYLFRDEINGFMTNLIDNFDKIKTSVIWCYGKEDILVHDIVHEVSHQLPACYGETSISMGRNTRLLRPTDFKRITDYFPELSKCQVPFRDGLARTISFWHRRIHYTFPRRFLLTGPKLRTKAILRKGGSIATKIIHGGDKLSDTYLEKTAVEYGYDGAGVAKLRGELKFYRFMKRQKTKPRLLDHYVRLLNANDNHGRVSLYFDYQLEGRTVADCVVSGREFPMSELCHLIKKTFRAGYLSNLGATTERRSITQLMSYYVNRPLDRLLHFIDNYRHDSAPKEARLLFRLLRNNEMVEIDGRPCQSPIYWLSQIEHNDEVISLLRPRVEGLCSHGDLTILNVLFDRVSRRMMLIDPRGTLGNWDPIYDLGKLTFSLSGFSHIILRKFSWKYTREGYLTSAAQSLETCIRERERLLQWILEDASFLELRAHEPHLRYRIEFAEAVHYLADVPFRFAKNHRYDDVCAVLLLGAKYLHRLMQCVTDKVKAGGKNG